MQSLRVSNTRCLPEKSSSRARGVFSNKTRFVFAHEAHLCHRTDFLFEALVAMLRTCVFLRRHHTFPRQPLEWSMRKRVTYRAGIIVHWRQYFVSTSRQDTNVLRCLILFKLDFYLWLNLKMKGSSIGRLPVENSDRKFRRRIKNSFGKPTKPRR